MVKNSVHQIHLAHQMNEVICEYLVYNSVMGHMKAVDLTLNLEGLWGPWIFQSMDLMMGILLL